MRSYFVRQGTFFGYAGEQRRGFPSSEPVSIHMLANTGMIVSPGAEVTFYGRNLRGVEVGGESARAVKRNSDSITVKIRLFLKTNG